MALDYLSLRSSASATASARVISCSTLTGSTLTGSSLIGSSLGSFPTTLNVSTLTGSTLTSNRVTTGSISVSTLTGSSLIVNSLTTGALGVSTLTGSTIAMNQLTTGSLSVTSTMISLGNNTQSTITGASQGSYASGSWITAKSGLENSRKVATSSTGQYQIVVSYQSSQLWMTSDSGVTWSALNGSKGLPTLTGSAYWSTGSISADGRSILLAVHGGSLWMSSDSGRTFSLTAQTTPDIWAPLNGNLTDLMGATTLTPYGSPGYVTVSKPGYSEQAIVLANTAGGTATQYVRGNWTGSPSGNFTVSFWFNAQSFGGYQHLFSSYSASADLILENASLYAVVPNGGGGSRSIIAFSGTLSVNTWYFVTLIFQTGGTCSYYLNNSLIGSLTNTSGTGTLTTSVFQLSGRDYDSAEAFNGYIADFRLYNSAITYNPIPLLAPNVWMPFENNLTDLGSQSVSKPSTIYLPFEGSVADQMGVSTVTPSGFPTYVVSNRGGYSAGQAINLSNTAGGTATQYVRGTWTTPTSFTASGWFNLQSYASGGNNQFIFSSGGTGNGSVILYINATNGLNLQIPNGIAITTGQTISLNTWYYFYFIIQPSGSTCYLYLNNSVYTGTANANTNNTGSFGLGTFDSSLITNAFNGYIDDFRIYNSVVSYNPVSLVTPIGSISYVPGVVGLNAVNLVNTAGGTATNYVRGACPSIGSDMTVSGWVNLQSMASSGYQDVFAIYYAFIHLYVDMANSFFVARFPSGSGGGVLDIPSSKISINTWYHFTMIFKVNGVCSFYLNGSLVGSITNSGGYGSGTSSGLFSLGTYENSTLNAFNGYIDDFRIYSAAIPVHALLPQNYRAIALSGNGQYALASASSGWVLGSLDAQKTWSKQAVSVGTQSDIIQPNKTGLASAQWEQNGVNWTVSASSTIANVAYAPYAIFNNSYANASPLGWADSGASYDPNTGAYVGAVSTTIQGIGVATGVWIQIQSSTPLVLESYRFATAVTANNIPRIYYLVGSNDGSTWYPLQYTSLTTIPTTTAYTTCTSDLLVNYTGIQTIQGNQTGSGSTISYSTSTTPYTYFRLILSAIWPSNASVSELAELYLNFARPSPNALALNYSGQYQLVATGPASGSIMPNQTGLAANTWSQGGVNWVASASSVIGSLYPYGAFNNYFGNQGTYSWASTTSAYNTSSGVYIGSISTTILGGIGAQLGEWLQIQTSVPLVLSSYTYGCGGYINLPKTYYIVGSMDGSNWYPLQYVAMTTNPLNTNSSVCSSYITTNTTGAITIQGQVTGSGTSTSYSYTTQPWMYFRFIGINIWNTATNAGAVEFGELYLNFSNSVSYSSNYGSTWLNSSSTMSNEIVSLSSSGQYALSTNSVAPLARLTFDNTNVDLQGSLTPATGAGTVTYSSSIVKVGTHSAYFNQTAGSTTPTVYLNYNTPNSLYTPPTLTMACWIYVAVLPTSGISIPIGFSDGVSIGGTSFFFNSGVDKKIRFAYTATISGYAEIYGGSDIVTNQWYHFVGVANAGVTRLYINGSLVTSGTYSGSICLMGGINMTNLVVGAQYSSGLYSGAFNGYVDDVRIYTTALSAHEVASLYTNPALTQSIGVSSSYLPITTYTKPTLPGVTTNVVDAKVSQTGQYMVAVTSAPTNNVYYSTDYGSSFTAVTIGTSTDNAAVIPLARLTMDNTNVDSLGALVPATGMGTVTYSSTVAKVGTHSAYFANTAGSTTPANYLNYTVPSSLNTPSALTMSCWAYLTALPSVNSTAPIALNSGSTIPGPLFQIQPSGSIYLTVWTTTGANANIVSSAPITLNSWTHLVGTLASGILSFYINGVLIGTTTITGNLSILGGGNITNLFVGAAYTTWGAWAGYVDDVRIYTTALSAADVLTLYSTPLARLTLDNTNVDSQGALVPATGAGTVTYSSSMMRVGTHSAYFANTAGIAPTNYLNYTVPASLNSSSAMTVSCWIYPTILASNTAPIGFYNGSTIIGPEFYISSAGIVSIAFATTNAPTFASLTTNITISANTWSNLVMVFGSGTISVYVNGLFGISTAATGLLCLNGGGAITNLMVGGATNSQNAFAGYVDDVRIYTNALSAGDVYSLYAAPPLTSCAISHDGSYITVANANNIYTLNKNTTGYSVAVGSQAGQVNQATNAIAIGNKAGQINQSANSIVLNASGSSLSAASNGFYVSPISTTAGLPMNLLGYGTDSQIVKTGVTVLPGGYIGIGTTNPNQLLDLTDASSLTPSIRLQNTYSAGYLSMGSVLGVNSYIGLQAGTTTSSTLNTPTLVVTNAGTVGIGTLNPSNKLTILNSNNTTTGYYSNTYNTASLSIVNDLAFNVETTVYGDHYTNMILCSNTSPSSGYNCAGAISFAAKNAFAGYNVQYGRICGIRSGNFYGGLSFGTMHDLNDGSLREDMRILNGKVGIGTTNPTDGPLVVYNTNGGFVSQKIHHATSQNWAVWLQVGSVAGSACNFMLFQGSDGNQRGSITSSGDNTIAYNTGSDLRFKDHIQTLTNPREYINQLRTCEFTMIGSNEKQIGFIAQEVKDVLPYTVTTGTTQDRYLYLDYSKFSPLAIAGVKDLYDEKDKLEARVESLVQELLLANQKLDALLAWANNQGFSG